MEDKNVFNFINKIKIIVLDYNRRRKILATPEIFLIINNTLIYNNDVFVSDVSIFVYIIRTIYYPDIDTKKEIIKHFQNIETVLLNTKIK